MEPSKLSRTDYLAIERTRLANERTFLAYFRTFIVILSSGLAIINVDVLDKIEYLGYALTIYSPLLLIIGGIRYLKVKNNLQRFYTNDYS